MAQYTQRRTEAGDGFYDAHLNQDGYTIEAGSAKPYVEKGFAPESLAAMRMELLRLSPTIDTWEAFGTPDVVLPEPFLIASAGGWAGLPKDYAYNHRTAIQNEDGTYTFHFNAPGKPNNMTTVEGWNIVLRLYRPTDFEAALAYLMDLRDRGVQIEALEA